MVTLLEVLEPYKRRRAEHLPQLPPKKPESFITRNVLLLECRDPYPSFFLSLFFSVYALPAEAKDRPSIAAVVW